MDVFHQRREQTRRSFLTSAGSGIGLVALATLLREEGLLAGPQEAPPSSPLAPKRPHFLGKAKHCIFIFQAGGSSHVDLFDPRPKLQELSGQPIPESLIKGCGFRLSSPAPRS